MPATLSSLGLMAITAFVAATIFPAQSEAVFLGLLAAKSAPPLALFVVASVANTAGAVANWVLGKIIADGGIHRLPARLRPSPEQLAKGEAQFTRYGWLLLLFSWLPVVGDIATVAAGTLRYRLWRFVLLVGIGKAARYAVLWAGFAAIW
ncbi:MAG: YqaA family protein [Bosea sp. (in: a-proteobacteria)]